MDQLAEFLAPPSGAIRKAGIQFKVAYAKQNPSFTTDYVQWFIELIKMPVSGTTNQVLIKALLDLMENNVELQESLKQEMINWVQDKNAMRQSRETALHLLDQMQIPFTELSSLVQSILQNQAEKKRLKAGALDILAARIKANPTLIGRTKEVVSVKDIITKGQNKEFVGAALQFAQVEGDFSEEIMRGVLEILEDSEIYYSAELIHYLSFNTFEKFNTRIEAVIRKGLTSRQSSEVRVASLKLLSSKLINSGYPQELINRLKEVVQNEENGLGISFGDKISPRLLDLKVKNGLVLFDALSQREKDNYEEVSDKINKVLGSLEVKERDIIVEIGKSFAEEDIFELFIDTIMDFDVKAFVAMDFTEKEKYLKAFKKEFKDAFFERMQINDLIREKVKKGYTGITELLHFADHHAFIKRDILHQIVTYRSFIDKDYADEEFLEIGENVQNVLPSLKATVIQLLNKRDLPRYEIQRLMRQLPLGNAQEIEEYRELARKLVMVVHDTPFDVKTGLFGKYRKDLHDLKAKMKETEALMAFINNESEKEAKRVLNKKDIL
jgi:hypothetical protein